MKLISFSEASDAFKQSCRLRDLPKNVMIDASTLPKSVDVQHQQVCMPLNKPLIDIMTHNYLSQVSDHYLVSHHISFDEYNQIVGRGLSYLLEPDANLMLMYKIDMQPIYPKPKLKQPYHYIDVYSWCTLQ